MQIKTKDTLFVKTADGEFVVRPGSTGVESKRVIYFTDVTGTNAVGFPKDICVNVPSLFSVSYSIEDKEVSLKDVLREISSISMPKELQDQLTFRLQSL